MKMLRNTCLLLMFFWGTRVGAHDNPFTLPLFKAYPALKERCAHQLLGVFPTPVIKAEKLGAVIGLNDLYIKNDGLSGIAFGGNKVRKLEFLLADAIARKAQTVLTVGGAGSNHALATAVYAKQLGLYCFSMLIPQLSAHYVRRNILLGLHYGAELFHFPTKAARAAAIAQLSDEYYKETKSRIYYIPKGGSNAIGALGFVNAAFELKEQIAAGLLKEPDFIYVSFGSKGTTVGLMVGLAAAGLKTTVIPVCDEEEDVEEGVQLISNVNELLHKKLSRTKKKYGKNSFWPITKEKEVDLQETLRRNVNSRFTGQCYAQVTPEAAAAIECVQQTEGITLDGTYSGKACAAMLDDAKNGKLKDKVVLFWDTYCAGNFENITASIDYHTLPKEFHIYFETPLQELDKGC